MNTLSDLAFFVVLARQPSLAAAAQQLGITPPNVSRRLAALEQRLGLRLLNRTTRRLSLTETGAAYYERCVQILDDLREADAEAGATTAMPRGRLRINAPLTFGNLHLAPLWGEFLKLHPAVELDITLTDRVVDLVEEGFDLAVRIGKPQAEVTKRTCIVIVEVASPGGEGDTRAQDDTACDHEPAARARSVRLGPRWRAPVGDRHERLIRARHRRRWRGRSSRGHREG